MIKAVLFDLDGTLLPMEQETFIKHYFGRLTKQMVELRGYDKDKFVKSVWRGLGAMMKNDGSMTNEERWWQSYTAVFGEEGRADGPVFHDFYAGDFNLSKDACGFNPMADRIIKTVKEKGFKAILATNPVFPRVATENRMKWAGLNQDDFELFTTYEDYSYCKPSLEYYKEIMDKTGLKPEECVMVGNDVAEDMIAEKLGMKVFLLTDCLINKYDADISHYPQGSFDRLADFIEKL